MIDAITIPLIGSVLPAQICPSGSGTVNVYNGDVNNVLLVSPSQNPALTNSVPVQPLTNATIDGTKQQYGIALTGSCANVTVGNALQMSPSPAQVAAQISALGLATLAQQITQQTAIPTNISTTGVPLLGAPASLYNYSNAAVPANTGATPVLNAPAGAAVVNMGNYLSYDLRAVVACNAAETSPFYLFRFDWCLDAAGASVAYTELWGIPSTVAGLTVIGNGPVRAQYLKVSMGTTGSSNTFNLSTFLLTGTSRPFVGDNPDFRTTSCQPPSNGGNLFVANGLGGNIGDNILGGATSGAANLAATSTSLFVAGLFCGGVNVNLIPPVALANISYTPCVWLPGIGLIAVSGTGAITNPASFAYTQVLRYAVILRFVSTNGAAQALNFNVIAASRG